MMTEPDWEKIEKLAVEHEDFGFGKADSKGISTHGFSPEGLKNFVKAVLELDKKV